MCIMPYITFCVHFCVVLFMWTWKKACVFGPAASRQEQCTHTALPLHETTCCLPTCLCSGYHTTLPHYHHPPGRSHFLHQGCTSVSHTMASKYILPHAAIIGLVHETCHLYFPQEAGFMLPPSLHFSCSLWNTLHVSFCCCTAASRGRGFPSYPKHGLSRGGWEPACTLRQTCFLPVALISLT